MSGRGDIRIFQADAFTARPFGGNPAAVCLVETAAQDAVLDVPTMQAIAAEMNLSETAFVRKLSPDDSFQSKWRPLYVVFKLP